MARSDGAPLEWRFAANRHLIERLRDDLQRRLDRPDRGSVPGLLDNGGSTDVSPPWMVDVLERDIAALNRMLEPGRNFLHFGWDGDGIISEWVGPVDAEHVVVLVPGVGTTKYQGATGQLVVDARRMVRHDPTGGELAVVTGLLYDPPDNVLGAVVRGPARQGAERIGRLVDGLPAGREITLVGHSYGSIVAAQSLFHLDSGRSVVLVLLGSPGVWAVDVSRLPIDPAHVWAGLVPGDEIQLAVNPWSALSALAGCVVPVPGAGLVAPDRLFAFAANPPIPSLGSLPLLPAFPRCDLSRDLFHGTNPASDRFGANVFDASVEPGPGGLRHVRYFSVVKAADGTETPTTAFRNLLAVVTRRRSAHNVGNRTGGKKGRGRGGGRRRDGE